ncbi:MAG: SycD/LcrH family type III secretion system chaperone [Alphaproteobacteria bacterium]|nr:SycD/LcrH family type III secretion system chaperone [Alphaproteobacteria bacterium]
MSESVQVGGIEFSGLTPEQKAALDALATGAELKDLRGLTDEDLETVYAIGFNLYNQAKYEQAEPLFQFACLYGNTQPRYWLALGNCRQLLKKYEAAIEAFGLAYFHDSDNAWPVIQTATCYLALGNRENAKDALELADKTMDPSKPDDAALQRIAVLRQAL